MAYSSTPTTRGAGTSGSGSASTNRRTVLRLTPAPTMSARRAAGPAREGKTDRGQGRPEPLGPLTVPPGQAGYLLDERATSALNVPAGEPADLKLENDASSRTWNISGKPQVGAVHLG